MIYPFFDKRRVALVRVLVGNFLSGASTNDLNLKGFSIIEIFRNEIFRKDKKSYSECQKITRVFRCNIVTLFHRKCVAIASKKQRLRHFWGVLPMIWDVISPTCPWFATKIGLSCPWFETRSNIYSQNSSYFMLNQQKMCRNLIKKQRLRHFSHPKLVAIDRKSVV